MSTEKHPAHKKEPATAVFAGGCFWGVEHIFARTPGVLKAESGYSGGTEPEPDYQLVSSGTTAYAEAVRVYYDPERISYQDLVRRFFEMHDPTQANRQGPDIGPQYRSIIFYANENERQIAEEQIKLLWTKGYDVATQLLPSMPFYRAEQYHQKYFEKHPFRTCHSLTKRFD